MIYLPVVPSRVNRSHLARGMLITFLRLGGERLGRQLDHVLVLEQVEAEVLERSRGPLQVNDSHALVQYRKHRAHQVLGIAHPLDLLPLGLLALD